MVFVRKLSQFWAKVAKAGPNDCWLWLGHKMPYGYGTYGKPKQLAHRRAWELTNGPIPDGLMVLHNCPDGDNPSCVNPAHLWLGTQTDNMRDAAAKGRISSQQRPENQPRGEDNWERQKTHCKNGHPFDDANTYWTKKGTRSCRACRNAAVKDHYRRNHKPSERPHYNSEKTHCMRGHALSGENLYVLKNGKRQCRACKALQAKQGR